jgi:hypothetical protein
MESVNKIDFPAGRDYLLSFPRLMILNESS